MTSDERELAELLAEWRRFKIAATPYVRTAIVLAGLIGLALKFGAMLADMGGL